MCIHKGNWSAMFFLLIAFLLHNEIYVLISLRGPSSKSSMKTRKPLHSSVRTLSSSAEISLALWNARTLAPGLESALIFIFSFLFILLG